MGFLAPASLLALSLLAIILALYLLRLRRPMAPVASLHLWDSLTRDREANTLWQRLRVSWLLILQLLALFVLILALARPWVSSVEPTGQNVIIVVDTSASMGAVDANDNRSKTRLQAAKEKALELVDDMPQDGSTTLISADRHASVIVPTTHDKSRLRDAINHLSIRNSQTDALEALKLASVMVARQANSLVWLLSDGAFAPIKEQIDSFPGELRFVSFGHRSSNQGITAMSVQHAAGNTQLFVQLTNADTMTVTRRVDINVDDTPWTARTIALPPGTSRELVLDDVPIGARVVSAQLSGPDDLESDDKAWAVNRASAPGTVLLVTGENKFLETALSLLPNVSLYKVAPADYVASSTVNGAPLDLTVFDGGVPTSTLANLPKSNLLIFAPQTSNTLVQVSGLLANPVPLAANGADTSTQVGAENSEDLTQSDTGALLRHVDLSSLHVSRAYALVTPAWGKVLLASDQGPLIIVGEESHRRVGLVAFDLHDSDLPLETAFPLLMRNLITYLLPDPSGGIPALVAPGVPVDITQSSPNVDRAVIEDPSAKDWSIALSPEHSRAAFAETDQPGVYYVSHYVGQQVVAQEAFAVNLFSRDESMITPNLRPGLPDGQVQAQIGGQGDTTQEQVVFKREFWPLVAILGFVLLLLEWVYAQRIALRRAILEWRTRREMEQS